ncbi:MAG: hypothetical protein JWP52_4042 [Rhizobacter sp.]|nr:hypothetical protein [Rhizobacter sp.]
MPTPLDSATVGEFTTCPVEFGRDGKLLFDTQVAQLKSKIDAAGSTDLLCLSHGWNNDEAEAKAMYEELLGNLDKERQAHPIGGGRKPPMVLLVYWPSKRFADVDLIPGGAASIDKSTPDTAIQSQIDLLRDAFTGPGRDDPAIQAVLARLEALLPQLETSDAACEDFVALVRSIFTSTALDEEPTVLDDAFFTGKGRDVLSRLSVNVTLPLKPTGQGGAAAGVPKLGKATQQGQAAGLGNLFKGIKNGAYNLLNLFTYYEMKERGGRVGGEGLAPLLATLVKDRPQLRLHLCGHSFGGRLMAATLAGLPPQTGVRSLTLLQSAFSHWGFATKYDGNNDGFFHGVFKEGRLAGPVLITYTANDRAVGLAYPLASRLKNQVAAGLGDANDPYGGIGRNGAQKTSELDPNGDTALLASTEDYKPFKAMQVYNLESSPFISGHGDIRNAAVTHALWTVVRMSA